MKKYINRIIMIPGLAVIILAALLAGYLNTTVILEGLNFNPLNPSLAVKAADIQPEFLAGGRSCSVKYGVAVAPIRNG